MMAITKARIALLVTLALIAFAVDPAAANCGADGECFYP